MAATLEPSVQLPTQGSGLYITLAPRRASAGHSCGTEAGACPLNHKEGKVRPLGEDGPAATPGSRCSAVLFSVR